jgi:hypothetical protein
MDHRKFVLDLTKLINESGFDAKLGVRDHILAELAWESMMTASLAIKITKKLDGKEGQ